MVAIKISEMKLGNYFWNNKQLWNYFEIISRQCWIIIPREPLCFFVFLPWHWRKVPSHCNIIIYLILSFRPLLLVCLWEHKEQTANQKNPSWNEIDSVGAEQSVINTVGRWFPLWAHVISPWGPRDFPWGPTWFARGAHMISPWGPRDFPWGPTWFPRDRKSVV